MTRYFWLGLVLCVTLVAGVSFGSVAAAACENAPEPVDPPEEVDFLEEMLMSLLQWLDKIFDSVAAGNTSVISIWNH